MTLDKDKTLSKLLHAHREHWRALNLDRSTNIDEIRIIEVVGSLLRLPVTQDQVNRIDEIINQ